MNWTGNPLTREGTRCEVGSIFAELMHVDAAMFGIVERSAKLRRSWILNISDQDSMAINGRCLTSVVLVDMMPEVAKREDEVIIGWAVDALS